MKKVAMILLLLSSAIGASAQAPDTLWTRTYGGQFSDECRSLQQTTDGGYVLAGSTRSYGDSVQSEGWLIKTQENGALLWDRPFGGDNYDEFYSVRQTADGGYILGGSTGSYGSEGEMWLVKTDQAGNTQWMQNFGGAGQQWCVAALQMFDGGYVMGGSTRTQANGHYDDFHIIKTDEQGNSEWETVWGFAPNSTDVLRGILLTIDGGFILVGQTTLYGASSPDFLIAKLNESGNLQWSHIFGGNAEDVCQSVVQTSDRGYVLAGWTYSYGLGSGDYWLMKVDSAGNQQWSRTFGGINEDLCTSIWKKPDGGFLLGGYTTSIGSGSADAWLVSTNEDGDSIWSTVVGGELWDQCFSLQQSPDGSCLLGGKTESFGAGGLDAWLIKIGLTQNCPQSSVPFLDNFDSSELDSCWYWIREDTSQWSLTERPGWMRIVPTGDISFWNNTAGNILLKSFNDTNVRIDAKLEFSPFDRHSAGVMVYMNDDDFVNIQRQSDGGIRSHSEISGQNIYADFNALWNPTYLRIEKIGSKYSTFASIDNTTWSHVATWTNDLTSDGIIKSGVWAARHEESPEIPADFDYFRVDPLPGTEVCGNVSGVWDSTGSPYYVTCDVTVPAGQTLEIQPGVELLFTGHFKFNVYGNLQAIGTEEDSIVFTRAYPTEESKWWGIRFYDSAEDSSELRYCTIEYGSADEGDFDTQSGGGLYIYRCNPAISNCIIRNNFCERWGGGVDVVNAAPTFRKCLIASNNSHSWAGGLDCRGNSAAMFERCVIASNEADRYEGGGALCNNSPLCSFLNCTITRNIAHGYQGGLACFQSTAIVSNCVIWGNVGSSGQLCGNITFSDVEGVSGGQGNIDEDPLFVDAANGDFHLQENSPCIDAGDPNSPYDPDSTIADMGAFHFPQVPLLFVSPTEINFGLQDIGADSVATIALSNPGPLPSTITEISHSETAFVVDTSGLNGQVGANSTYEMQITFAPTTAGYFYDELMIVAERAGNDTIVIPLSGEASIIAVVPESLVVKRGSGNDIQLHWNPVTETISGQPLEDPQYHIHAAGSEAGPFLEIGVSDSTGFVHAGIVGGPGRYFYQVRASAQ